MSGLAPVNSFQGALARADTPGEVKRIIDMAHLAVDACLRTKRSLVETNGYAAIAVQGTVKAGRLLAELERNPGARTDLEPPATVAAGSPYAEALAEAQIPERTARYWQKLRVIPDEAVMAYLGDVDAELEQISVAGLMEWAAEAGVAISLGGLKASTSVEWYTPAKYIDAAREVMGSIDLDPASSDFANETVGAARYITKDDDPDGLNQAWTGNVWLNPPYGKGSGLFTTKLVGEFSAGRVRAGVLLLNAYGFDSDWFQALWRWPLCFTDHRITFYSPQRESGGPANGNLFAYLGPEPERFADVFTRFGQVVRAWP